MVQSSFDKTWKYFDQDFLNLKLKTYVSLKMFSSCILKEDQIFFKKDQITEDESS